MSRAEKTKAAYRAALRRLEKGRPSNPRLVGRSPVINVSTVCLEAGLSRNPLYAQHREVLDEIHNAARRQQTGRRETDRRARTRSRSSRRSSQDRRAVELGSQLAKARSENLTLLFRLQEAELRLLRASARHKCEE